MPSATGSATLTSSAAAPAAASASASAAAAAAPAATSASASASASGAKVGESTEFATLAAGCFWSVELAYQRLPGVLSTEVGYTNGTVKNPTYKQVCSGNTGHAEAVRLTFDPAVVSFGDILGVFWKKHDPTTLNRQGNDIGTQYRSGIYYHSEQQKAAAVASAAAEEKKRGKKVVTEIAAATEWYAAEENHQRYLEKDGQSTAKGCNDFIHCYGKPKKGFWG